MSLHSPLEASRRQIRCLRLLENLSDQDTIECELPVVSLLNSPTYHALSYTWGDPDVTQAVTVNGREVQVTTTLFAALSTLKITEPELDLLWVDALCIDQNDFADKNQQLPVMPAIYGSAERTHVWLGDASEDSEAAFDDGLDQIHL